MAYPQTSFADTEVHTSSLVGRRREAVRLKTLLYQLNVLKETGRYDAFKLKWHPSYDDSPNHWPVPNHLFWDSDVGKWIEGACYFLKQHPNDEVDKAVKELVEMIRGAQQPDGYLNIHYTVVEPDKRWSNLKDMHELYNCGHLIEGALAHQDHYKNDRFMEPMLKYVDLLYSKFGPGEKQSHGYPGHPEIELALLRLYDRTGDKKHLDLAKYFVTERGNPKGEEGKHFYDVEAERRGDDVYKRPSYYPEPRAYWYHQAHKPIAEQETIEGHSVRAMYLLTAAADLVREDRGSDYQKLTTAIDRLWSNMVDCKMYSTGGIGAMSQWEGFGIDYFLPQGTDEGGCYAETCASIGIMMLADRLLKLDLDGKYTDVLELCLYNTVLTSMSHDGKAFTYDNQLASSDSNPSRREEWFTCACCPPNVLRVLGMIGGYIWTHDDRPQEQTSDIIVNLFISASLKYDVGGQTVELEQKTEWPWTGDVNFSLNSSLSKVGMKIRIPGWASSYELSPPSPDAKLSKGYLSLPAEYLSKNKNFKLSIPIAPRLIASHPFTNQSTLAVARGPVVYCAEDHDNSWVEDHFKTISLSPEAKIYEHNVSDQATGDQFVSLTVTEGISTVPLNRIGDMPWMETEDSNGRSSAPKDLQLIPYYFRANRGGRGQMRVGMKRAM